MIRYDFNLYVYDSTLKTYLGFVDGESLEYFTWADRRHSPGDFQAKLPQNQYLLNLLQPGNWITMSYSNSLMRIDEMVNQTFMEQGATIQIRGRSIDTILHDRVVPFKWAEVVPETSTETPIWRYGLPSIAHRLLRGTLVLGYNPDDIGNASSGISAGNILTDVTLLDPNYGAFANLEANQVVYVGDVAINGGDSLGETVDNLLADTNFQARIVNVGAANGALALRLQVSYIIPSTGRFRIGYEEGTLKNYRYLSNTVDKYNIIMVANDTHFYYFSIDKFGNPPAYYGDLGNRVYSIRTDIETTNTNYRSTFRKVADKALRDLKVEFYIDGEIDFDTLIGSDPIGILKLGQQVEIIDTWGSPATLRVVEEIIYTYDEDGLTVQPTLTEMKPDRGNYPVLD